MCRLKHNYLLNKYVLMFIHDNLHVTCIRSGFIADSLTKQPLQTLGNDFVLLILLAYVIIIIISIRMSVSLKNFLAALYLLMSIIIIL